MPRIRLICACALATTFVGAPECVVHGDLLRTVALTGRHAPGTPDGTEFVGFKGLPTNGPVINNLGQAAFRAVVSARIGDTSVVKQVGVWSEHSGDLDLVVLGDSLYPVLNDRGDLAFYGGAAIWMTQRGSLLAVASARSQAADVSVGTTYFSVSNPRINNRGELIFRAFLQPNTDGGIWAGTPDGLRLIARQLDQAAGVEFGEGRYLDFLFNPSINDSGQVAFLASLVGTRNCCNDDSGIWTGHAGALRLVAQEGSNAPGTPNGSVFDRLNPPTLGNQGQVAYVGFLRVGAGGVIANNSQGIWLDHAGVPSIITRAGDRAPGTPAGVVFRSFNNPVLGGNGQIAFRGFLLEGPGGVRTENRMGIWAGEVDQLKLIARSLDPAPDTLGNFGSFNLDSLNMNSRGRVAFLAELQVGEGGVTKDNNYGIWAEDASGVLRLVVRTGTELEVAPNDFRALAGIDLLGDTTTVGSGFNDLGQVAFIAKFSDGTSGILLSNLVAVAEPDSSLLILLASVAFCTTRVTR